MYDKHAPNTGMRVLLFLTIACALCAGLLIVRVGKSAYAAPLSTHRMLATSTVNWNQFGYRHTRFNPFETTLNPSNVSHLTPKWATYVGDVVDSSPAIVDGVIYIGSYDHAMKALDAASGQLLWSHQLATPPPNSLPEDIDHSSPAVANGLVYVGTAWPNIFYAFKAKTGAIAWSFKAGSGIDNSPVIYNDAVYFGSDDQKLYALQAGTGKLLWSFQVNGRFYESSPIIANGTVYFCVDGGTFYAVNATTGKLLWSQPGYVPNMPVVANGVVYASFYNDTQRKYGVAALNGQMGSVLWRTFTSDIYGRIQSSPAIANGVVYIGTGDSKIFALNASTGAVQWTYTNPLNTSFDVAPAVANGVLYTGDAYGQFLALNAQTGKVLWSYEPPKGEVYCSPVVVNGTLYIGANNGFLYKFDLS